MRWKIRGHEWLVVVYILGWLAVILVQCLRSHTRHAEPLSTIYGVLPNYIAAIIAPLLFLLVLSRFARPGLGPLARHGLSAALGALAVGAWEIHQIRSATLVFDSGDLVATVLGALTYLACWRIFERLVARTRGSGPPG